ncbi:hypothetical protein ALC57_18636 [Trachymyrmex cornetzi]|uniref:DDE-1 domain-containing protein n=1 Tax=Trachymyrmex cornetzi TaxID=471704 RepID=A0A151IRD9_9HYME|nr:hypothetical protein ALC57_18636 [Trachymyrmex cornetzi]
MRNYKRKTDRGIKSVKLMKEAVELVIKEKHSIRSIARNYNICRQSLKRCIERYKNNSDLFTFGYASRSILTADQETSLTDYLLKLSQIFHGIGSKEVRHWAYDIAVKYDINIPCSWHANKMAGTDWLTAFLKRNKRLSIRRLEATSLSRATSFNKTNVNNFFDKFAMVMDKYKFSKGKRNAGSITSAEREINVTVLVAAGMFVPPMFLFPRKKYRDYFVRHGPPDCISMGNASGWMTDVEFYGFMNHFIKHVKPSKDSPVLLLVDNHSSHLSIKTLDLAKENGVVMLSFPPHCSYKLQPLDVAVYGPFKKYLSSAQDAWLRSNPGKTMTIYDIPSIVRTSLPLALSFVNIIKGFEKSGIFPFNKDIFDESDYAPSYVTDRSDPMDRQDLPSKTLDIAETETLSPVILCPVPFISRSIETHSPVASTSMSASKVIFPEVVRPFPKAGPRKMTTRKRRRTTILTETPEKTALAMEQDKNKKKYAAKQPATKKKKQIKKKILQDYNDNSCSAENEYFCLVCCEAYTDSAPGKEWVQCSTCKGWAHANCSRNTSISYVCVNCNDDE